ncbi:MAG: hypothetical protein EKK47_10465 [Burkholderiales bacterium]|nr:MAG: hypothetical protein EKK47_10465 [Burkholderiales bacterium]
MLHRTIDEARHWKDRTMLDLINDYLLLGVKSTADSQSVWTLTVATVLVAAMILSRQSRD